MTKSEYETYKNRVDSFFRLEGIENLSTGPIDCDDCNCGLEAGECPECGKDSGEINQESYFSWRPCDCCGTSLGGNREDATGYNRERNAIQSYSVCEDCVYFAEYGQLDDTTMMEME